ncbi:beta-propeller domain-containing protein [Micromonospora sp. NBC_01796]|uniref:beta-propeller domain-containing protein n=1 Tax=Micromonospora sp. NBC_01796 TaxID=2975987 RepID=UPI002DD94C23|nr:beta-propeller domain-containing protein [Micromonospora sp. NBC_01796]WSA88498.1 beta-propeller domain-containing protein [Micromonospora sp. NBC_01796]
MTRRRFVRPTTVIAGCALVGTLALVAASGTTPTARTLTRDPGVPAAGWQLVAFDSCADALTRLKSAAKAYVGPWGFGGGAVSLSDAVAAGSAQRAAAPGAAPPAGAGAPGPGTASDTASGYSGTNTHEVGVDEPDLVKTDGRRIVTVSGGVLYVVDPATRQRTGRLELFTGDDPGRWSESNLLLHGDRALVLVRDGWGGGMPAIRRPGSVPGPDGMPPASDAVAGPRLILVDLAGPPRVLAQYHTDGSLVDARQVGATVRIVVRSAPRLSFPYKESDTDAQRIETNQDIIDASTAQSWLPRYEITTGGTTRAGQVGCERLVRPASYSGTSMVTLLSFDLGAATLNEGDPLTVVADGDTVYSTGARLYLTNDQRWQMPGGWSDRGFAPQPRDETTEIYQFDTSGTGTPRYLAATTVPGWLINQYALSEWDGHLRVATTTGQSRGTDAQSSSAVYVLRADGRALTETGRVTGLGKGERIYAVRFVAGTGYVVTFRQTDPLYTVDLTRPAAPRVVGELKISGYSAYLHPVDGNRLLGIGQEATDQGRTQGTQLSLFDVSDPARPNRLAQHHVRQGNSEAEHDPHAFLYWPADRLVVVPLTAYESTRAEVGRSPTQGALALRVTEGGFTQLGLVEHTREAGSEKTGMIRRSLVVNGVLWTVSDVGLKANQLSTMDAAGWVELS